jgi:integrase
MGHTTTEMLFRVYSRYVPNLTRRDGSAMGRLLAADGLGAEAEVTGLDATEVDDDDAE